MTKERKQDLSSPEEEALEQRVHDMLDITVPDEQPVTAPEIPKAEDKPKKASKSISISVTHSDDEVKKEDPELTAAIAKANEQLAHEVSTAPLVESKAKKSAKEPVAPDEQPVEEGGVVNTDAPEEQPVSETPTEELDTTATVGELMETTSPLEAEIESAETEKAVSDIIAKESDELLSVQDAAAPVTEEAPKKSKDSPSLLSLIVRSPSFRWTVFALLVIGLSVVAAYPKTRYYLLNKAGVRSSASVVVTDRSTLQPLKNVKVSLAGQTVMSDQDGKANLTNLQLGPTELVIEKRAYASEKQAVTVGWGSNPFEDVALKPQGQQYTFQVNDFFSGKPITEVEASVGESSATANEKGEIKLALDEVEADEVTVKFAAVGYRTLEYKLNLANKEPITVAMTLSKPVAFISKRAGTLDLYKIDVDGKNETLVLKGTGKESNDVSLFQHPTNDVVMLLSARDGTHGADGMLKQTLTYVNLKDNTSKTVIASSQLKAIDWIGTRLVYVVLDDNAAQDSTSRYKLMSYDYISGDNRQLATTNYFNSVISMGGKVYYAPSSAHQNGVNIGVFAVHADGSGKSVVLDKEAWNMFRTAHDTLTIAVQQEWYSFKSGASKPDKLSGQPSDTTSRLYIDAPGSKHSAWLDNRDGKGAIILYDTDKKTEDVLLSESGVSGPVRWLNSNTLVYRLTTSRETADYIMSINGGEPHKITNVTNTSGIERWSL